MTYLTKNRVQTSDQALSYLAECILATVSSMALLKRKNKSEYARQIAMAQTAVNWVVDFGGPISGRVADVLNAGSVEKWVKQYER